MVKKNSAKNSGKLVAVAKPAPVAAPPLNRTGLLISVTAYVLWLLFLLAVASGLIR